MRAMKKSGQQTGGIWNLLLIILGVLVVVVLAAGFIYAYWDNIIGNLKYAPADSTKKVETCNLWASQGINPSVCTDFTSTKFPSGEVRYVSCEYSVIKNQMDPAAQLKVNCETTLVNDAKRNFCLGQRRNFGKVFTQADAAKVFVNEQDCNQILSAQLAWDDKCRSLTRGRVVVGGTERDATIEAGTGVVLVSYTSACPTGYSPLISDELKVSVPAEATPTMLDTSSVCCVLINKVTYSGSPSSSTTWSDVQCSTANGFVKTDSECSSAGGQNVYNARSTDSKVCCSL